MGQQAVPQIRRRLAVTLGVPASQVNIAFRYFVRLTLAAIALLAVTACGGGGSTSPPPPPPPPAMSIASSAPPGGTVGSQYSPHVICSYHCHATYGFTLSASGGVGNVTWAWAAASGSSLPPGLSLADNLISGTPPIGSVGSYNVIVTATDGGTSPAKASRPYTITIVNPPPPEIVTLPGPPGATLNQPYGYHFQANGFAPVTVSETGTLPPGIAPLTTTGLLAGTPSSAGVYPIIVHATDALGQDSAQAFTIGVFQHGFAPTGAMQSPRSGHTATLLPSGQVLVIGGVPGFLIPTASAELFTPVSGSFATTAALQVARAYHTATLLCDLAVLPCTNSHVLVVGGSDGADAVSSAELYDASAGTFTLTLGSLATARSVGHTATRLRSGKVLIVGGAGGSLSGVAALASAELFDPATGYFTATATPMASARSFHTATLLADGRVLIAGGYDGGEVPLNSAELYDPVTETFSTIPSPMKVARYEHTATLLPNGKVLVAGGLNGNYDHIAAAELYDPAAVAPAASFNQTGALITPRGYHTAVLLPSGQVLVAGGNCGFESLQHAELYDPASGLFAPTGGMQSARAEHTLTSLGSSGKVLVVGGRSSPVSYDELNTAEIYQ